MAFVKLQFVIVDQPHNMMCPGQKKNHFIFIFIPFPLLTFKRLLICVHFTLNSNALSKLFIVPILYDTAYINSNLKMRPTANHFQLYDVFFV